jgi:catechol 2,3-dioxygenase-like lactoylglutathione lyase family enzyme
MVVKGIGFVGIRSERSDEMVKLCRDLLGMPLVREGDGVAGFSLADGTVLEVYGPQEAFHAFFNTGPVVGFRVDDFDATRSRMIAAGVSFVGVAQHRNGESWQHFHCPDGTIAEIIGPGAPPSDP